MPTWADTKLWKRLVTNDHPAIDAIRTWLKAYIPLVETVLNSSGTAPTDFTLHDASHAFRVAERMIDIIPAETLDALSPYELTHLLASAYLHDIGMTPQQVSVHKHFDCLLSGERSLLTPAELESFQSWLDEQRGSTEIPLTHTHPSPYDLTRARLLIAHYCRAKHNEWSADWITKNLHAAALSDYPNFRGDLTLICMSHHYGLTELAQPRFDATLVGQPPQHVNLRYLACILRIADILEFDPERTPDVILKQRDISPGSIIYWTKDHDVALSVTIDSAGKRHIIFSSRPRDARTHRALMSMVAEIDHELQLCQKLSREHPFDRSPTAPDGTPHRWDLPSSVSATIAAYEARYEYIDGSFRPDIDKLLQLFGGLALYNTRMAAIREALQNSFDAVRQSIAYERLTLRDPFNEESLFPIRQRHQIELRLVESSGVCHLQITDTGVGMTKELILGSLLASGGAPRRDVRRLQRRSRDAGFVLERTGQFGIGVLSYFMISDDVTFHTRRFELAEDVDSTGWLFKTDGVDGFGELQRLDRPSSGTTVTFALRSDVTDPQEIVEYILRTVRTAPCQLTIDISETRMSFGPGWTASNADISSILIDSIFARSWYGEDTELQTEGEIQRRASEEAWEAETERAVRQAIELRQTDTCKLPDIGEVRITIPVFHLDGGKSLIYVAIQEENGERFICPLRRESIHNQVDGLTADTDISYSLFGMQIDIQEEKRQEESPRPRRKSRSALAVLGAGHSSLVEVDITNPQLCRIPLSRRSALVPKDRLDALRRAVLSEAQGFAAEVALSLESEFQLVSCAMFDAALPDERFWFWTRTVVRDGRERRLWERVEFPAFCGSPIPGLRPDAEGLNWKGRLTRFYSHFHHGSLEGGSRGATWGHFAQPHRLVGIHVPLTELPVFLPLYETFPRVNKDGFRPDNVIRFPPALKSISGAQTLHGTFWNKDHKAFQMVSARSWEWAMSHGLDVDQLYRDREALATDREKAATFLCVVARSHRPQAWQALIDNDREFADKIWGAAFGAERPDFSVAWLRQTSPNKKVVTRLIELSSSGFTEVDDTDTLRERLAVPESAEWWVQ